MKYVAFTKVPLDMAIFLGITLGGFGLSIKELAFPYRTSVETESSSSATGHHRESHSFNIVPDRFLDLGCLERRGVHGKTLSEYADLRIQARFCDLGKKELTQIHSISLRNLTTGQHEALALDGQRLVSTVQRMQHGKNVLQLEWRVKNSAQLNFIRTDVFEK